MLHRAVLNELSAAFADRLFHDNPKWETLANNLDGGSFRLDIPQPGADRVLGADTEDGEITIGFGDYHTHFGSFLGLSDQEAVTQATDEIRAVLAEEAVVVVHFRDGRWAGSMCVRASETISSLPGISTEVYSWRGTYDRTLS